MERTTRRVVLPVVGLATAAVTTTAGVLPALAGPSGGNQPSATTSSTSTTTSVPDGTYQSCSAYFGYGKRNGGTELVEFDTAVTGGKPTGAAPTVPNGGIAVVLEIHGAGGPDGNSITCVPQQVTQAEWDAEWSGAPFPEPAYPGPGHYVYPSVTPNIVAGRPSVAAALPAATGADIGSITSVAFRVTSVPEGYSLVSPTGAKTLQQNAFGPLVSVLQGTVPSVLASVVSAGPGGQAAVDALQAATSTCSDGGTLPDVTPLPLQQALTTLAGYLGVPGAYDPSTPVSCGTLFGVLAYSSYVAGARATATYSETITVSLPVAPTTAPTSTPSAAQPAVVTPRFTG